VLLVPETGFWEAPIGPGRIVGKQELISLLLENGRAKIISLSAKNNRSFDWFVIGEKKKRREAPAEDPLLQNTIVRN
jgi:hypothetical protein